MELQGKVAPPMANGELVFARPWEGRVFGMARALSEQGLYEWDEFRERLISEVEAWESEAADEPYDYYALFLNALTRLLEEKGMCDPAVLHSRETAFAARPHGHDH